MVIQEKTKEKKEKEKTLFSSLLNKKKEIKIADLINVNTITFLEKEFSRDEAIEILVENTAKFGVIESEKRFFSAILEREKIVSTGIGMGVAIPHAKLPMIESFFITIGVVQNAKAIEWNSIDSGLVRLIFMIGGPDNKQKEYLQILSHLTKVIKDESIRKKIISSKNKQDIIALLSEF